MATFSIRTLFQHVFDRVNYGSAVLSVASVPASSISLASTITVPGAAVGDIVDVSSSSVVTAGLLLTGEVTAANTVALKFTNPTVGALVPVASTTYRVVTYPFSADFSA